MNMKNLHARIVSFLLVLILLMQVPAMASNEDSIDVEDHVCAEHAVPCKNVPATCINPGHTGGTC